MTLNVERIQFPDEIVARALVLLAGGHNLHDIERRLGKEFPNERTPSRESVRQWDMALAETCQEESSTRVSRIISLADTAVAHALRGIITSETPERYAMSANAIAGTYRDKEARSSGGTINIVALVTERAAAIKRAIEGEYRALPDGDTDDPALNDVSIPAAREPKRDATTGTPGA